MSAPVYILRNLPAGLFDASKPAPFRHAIAQWRKLGLEAVVSHVTGNGVLNANRNGTTSLSVWPAGQEYQPLSATAEFLDIDGDLSIGFDSLPTPADLDNGNPLGLQCGELLLNDGNVWLIPLLREIGGDSYLPTDLTRDRKTGRLLSPIKRDYAELWKETEYWFDLRVRGASGEASTFELERGLAFATQVIGLRYRFCDAMQSLLRAIDSTNVMRIIELAIGWPAVLELLRKANQDDVVDPDQKKTDHPSAEKPNGDSGRGASGHTIGRPEANSGAPRSDLSCSTDAAASPE